MRSRLAISMLLLLAPPVSAADSPRTLVTDRPVVSIREGDILRKDAWRLAPEVSPDIYEAEVTGGRSTRVSFESESDSISFEVEEGKSYDFVIRHGKNLCATRIVGIRVPPAAKFDAAYRREHADRFFVEIPEVYELVNVAIALTRFAIEDPWLVARQTDYYREVRSWFDPLREHAAIRALDGALRANPFLYSNLKMNGYSFVFDDAGRIVQSPVYDRTSFPSERRNTLRPFISQLQAFADESRFREFYRAHRGLYDEQISFYTKTADLEGMRQWLAVNFPGLAPYDAWKIVFSPLVAGSQSSTWLESNGFRELQAHVNYPYKSGLRHPDGRELSLTADRIWREDIVFTELNHGFINPEAEKYEAAILAAISRRDCWVDPAKGPGYYEGISAFNEYMNWVLVALRIVDLAPAEEQALLLAAVDRMTGRGRGFPQFPGFSAFLVDRWRRRSPTETVADLYPEIVGWFERQNGAE